MWINPLVPSRKAGRPRSYLARNDRPSCQSLRIPNGVKQSQQFEAITIQVMAGVRFCIGDIRVRTALVMTGVGCGVCGLNNLGKLLYHYALIRGCENRLALLRFTLLSVIANPEWGEAISVVRRYDDGRCQVELRHRLSLGWSPFESLKVTGKRMAGGAH